MRLHWKLIGLTASPLSPLPLTYRTNLAIPEHQSTYGSTIIPAAPYKATSYHVQRGQYVTSQQPTSKDHQVSISKRQSLPSRKRSLKRANTQTYESRLRLPRTHARHPPATTHVSFHICLMGVPAFCDLIRTMIPRHPAVIHHADMHG